MRTTLDLPEHLLLEAMKITHTNTKMGVIVRTLEELTRKGKIDLDIDLNEIRDRH